MHGWTKQGSQAESLEDKETAHGLNNIASIYNLLHDIKSQIIYIHTIVIFIKKLRG